MGGRSPSNGPIVGYGSPTVKHSRGFFISPPLCFYSSRGARVIRLLLLCTFVHDGLSIGVKAGTRSLANWLVLFVGKDATMAHTKSLLIGGMTIGLTVWLSSTAS